MRTANGGSRGGWKCATCKHQSANRSKFESERCQGSAASRWAAKALELVEAGISVGRGHTRVLSGDTLWCLTCGAFADTKAVQLTGDCKGAPTVLQQGHYGGRWGQKLKLLKRVHPALAPAYHHLSLKMGSASTLEPTPTFRRTATVGRSKASSWSSHTSRCVNWAQLLQPSLNREMRSQRCLSGCVRKSVWPRFRTLASVGTQAGGELVDGAV